MPDSKITALTSISTSTDPANDPLVIVDVSDTSMAATGTTKKVTLNNLLACSPTATLASATISGDLTVRTSQLKVDSVGVGVGTTDTSTGKLCVNTGDGTVCFRNFSLILGSGTGAGLDFLNAARSAVVDGGIRATNLTLNSFGANPLILLTNSTERMRIDASGNVGIGVQPSAWRNTQRALQIGAVGACFSSAASTGSTAIGRNVYENSAGDFTYIVNDEATFYEQTATGVHAWYSAVAGTGTISFGDAKMTLDASGNLLVRTANASVTSGTGCRLLPNNGAAGHFTLAVTTNQSTAATSCYDFYSTSAAAYRFYVTSAGVINATNTTISAISDARLKENVQDIDVGLGAILALKPRKFDWKAGKGKDIKGDRGFIAQEFEEVFPNLIDEWKDPAPEGEAPYKSVRQDLIPVLVKAIQELAARVQTLETR